MEQKTMMAANLHGIGDLRYEAVPMPELKEDEVLVAIKYCGICGSDVGRVLKSGTYHFPTIPGHEFAGVVELDPTGELTGKSVCVFPLIPCRECEMCREENYELCSHYDYYGSRRDGGYAEYLAVKRWNILELPDNVSLKEGAMCEPLSVAHHAVARLGDLSGKVTLVSGAGPIGLLVAQWMRYYGARRVLLFDIDPAKILFAQKMGFEEYTDGEMVDAAVEGTGFGDALARILKAVKPHGNVVLMGNPSRPVEMSQDTYWCIMRKELYVTGTWNSSYGSEKNDWKASLKALSEKKLDALSLASHEFPLSQCNEAFATLVNREIFTNRVLLKIGE